MDIEKVVSLSLLEGLTEFIPVSSTGHLILLSSLIGEQGDSEKLFEVFIQLGAILAIFVLYFNLIVDLAKSLFSKKSEVVLPYSPYAIIIACVPALFFGFLFYKYIKSLLFYPVPVAIALIVGGIGLIVVEKLTPKTSLNPKEITLRQSLTIGLFQCLSLWPGMSRSGSCLIGARLAGVPRVLAAEFSFVVALPIMVIAVGYDTLKNLEVFLSSELSMFLVGFVVAFLSGLFAVKNFINYLAKFSLVPFGFYRIILGSLVLGFQLLY